MVDATLSLPNRLHRVRALAAGGRARIRRIRSAAWWFPLTSLGGAVAALGLFAVFGPGRRSSDLVFLGAGVAALVVLGVLIAGTWLRLVVLARDLRSAASGPRVAGECDRGVRTGFRVPRRPLLGWIDVAWRWRRPEAQVEPIVEGRWWIEEVRVTRRHLGGEIVREFSVGDPFGLARVTWLHREIRPTRFVPSRGNLRDVDLVRGMAGGDTFGHPDGTPDGDPIDLRPYAVGDPVRIILWKVYARSRELVVRTPERALSPTDRTVAYVVAGHADEPAAGAARVAVEGGTLGRDWLLGADGNGRPTRLSDEAMDLLARSADASSDDSGAGLGAFLHQASTGGANRAVVFVPAAPGPWLDRVTGAVAAGQTDVDFLVCVDGVDFGAEGSNAWWRDAGPAASLGANQLRQTLRRLVGTRRRVTVIDRQNGRVVDASSLLRGGDA